MIHTLAQLDIKAVPSYRPGRHRHPSSKYEHTHGPYPPSTPSKKITNPPILTIRSLRTLSVPVVSALALRKGRREIRDKVEQGDSANSRTKFELVVMIWRVMSFVLSEHIRTRSRLASPHLDDHFALLDFGMGWWLYGSSSNISNISSVI